MSSSDPYVYPGTTVLRNLPGIRDAAALKVFEHEQSAARIVELRFAPIEGKFDLAHLRSLHRHIFQDVYEWAGKTRSVEISKGQVPFARAEFIEPEGRRLGVALAADGHLVGMPREKFVERLTSHYADWNALHPFREGNGRSTRAFFAQLTNSAGFELDVKRIEATPQRWEEASRLSFYGNNGPLRDVFSDSTRVARAAAFERLPTDVALKAFPELQGAVGLLQRETERAANKLGASSEQLAAMVGEIKATIVARLEKGEIVESSHTKNQGRDRPGHTLSM